MDLRAIVSDTYDSVTKNLSAYAVHPETGLRVSTKMFGRSLWTLVLENKGLTAIHAYPETPAARGLHEIIPGDRDETPAFALLQEVAERINGSEPYVLACNSERIHIPDRFSELANLYQAVLVERLDNDLSFERSFPMLAPALEETLERYGSLLEQPSQPMLN